MRILPPIAWHLQSPPRANLALLRLRAAAVARGIHWHQHAEGGPPRGRIALNGTPMIADDLGDQCKSEATSGSFSGDERLEEMRLDLGRDPGSIVADTK